MPLIVKVPLLSYKEIYLHICDTLTGIISRVGIYELGCLPNAEAALLCYETVKATAS